MKHLKYLRYLARHKWFVLVACFRRGLYWQGIIHDWSKFLLSEWLPYAQFFYGNRFVSENAKDLRRISFDRAWLEHQHRSPHHWQHWVLRNDDGSTVALNMPRRYLLEMLCDWEGAGRAITGKIGGTPSWYAKNRHKMLLHPATRAIVEMELGITEATEDPITETVALRRANDICRSMHSIAERDGLETNWPAFRTRLTQELDVQHALLFPKN